MAKLEGQTLSNRYFLRKYVKSGGMADVYVGWDKLRSSQLAIKVLKEELLSDARFFRSFSKEAEILHTIEHPNIVRLYEFDRDGNVCFLVMDWIDGSNLKDRIKTNRKPLSLAEVSRILQPITAALHFAHQHEVFHCDIKPGNILLHKDGNSVLLTDFGVARHARELTSAGTVAYMAPEQFYGDYVTAETDVYGIGITIFEMLSGGYVPFRGDSPSSQGATEKERIGWEHVNLDVPSLRKYNRSVPNEVIQVITKALAKSPHDRYRSTTELWNAFERAIKHQPPVGVSEDSRTAAFDTIRDAIFPQPPKIIKDTVGSITPYRKIGVPHLLALSGEHAGKSFQIKPEAYRIGRSSKNDLQIREKSVSRMHAVIWQSGKKVFIRDEDSTLGTIINNQTLKKQQTQLKNGDQIQIGYSNIFEFRIK